MTSAKGAGGENRMASYVGIWRALNYFLFESDGVLWMRETRTRHESRRRHSTVRDNHIDLRLLWQTNIGGQVNLAVFDYAFKCRHAHAVTVAANETISKAENFQPLIDADLPATGASTAGLPPIDILSPPEL